MPYTHLVYFITFLSLLMIQTACNHTQHRHMLPNNQQLQQEPHSQNINQTDCPICLESLNNPEKSNITLKTCHHIFHKACILQTMNAQHNLKSHSRDKAFSSLTEFKLSITCPNCRNPILNKTLLYHPSFMKNVIQAIQETMNMDNVNTFIKMIEELFEDLGDINLIKSENENSLLHIVVADNNNIYQSDQLAMTMATTLIQKNIDINAKNNQDWTPLHLAASLNDTTMIKCLIDHHADINAKNDWDWTPLHLAIQAGHLDAIKLLIERGADVNAPANLGFRIKNFKLTPIYFAIYYQNMEALKLLIKNHANANTKAIFDLTPLHFAALCNNKTFQKLAPQNKFTGKNYDSYVKYIEERSSSLITKNSFGQTYKDLQNTTHFDLKLLKIFQNIYNVKKENTNEDYDYDMYEYVYEE